MGMAGEPRPELEDREIGVATGGARGKRNGVPISSSIDARGEAVPDVDATGMRGFVYKDEVDAVGLCCDT